jgi:hypothetical protein
MTTASSRGLRALSHVPRKSSAAVRSGRIEIANAGSISGVQQFMAPSLEIRYAAPNAEVVLSS